MVKRAFNHPGAGIARKCTVSSMVGTHCDAGRTSKTAGGMASAKSASEATSGGRPSVNRNHPETSAVPDGAPRVHPTVGLSRTSMLLAIREGV